MSTVVPSPGHRHRHTQGAVAASAPASSKNPQNPHHLNLQSSAQNSQSEMSDSYQSAPTTPPRTPRRNDQAQDRTTSDNGSKQKSRNKNRSKNVAKSPAVNRKGRSTPPVSGAQFGGIPSSAKPISTSSTTAYAGATFHASPAPSALPIPSFYSKSVPESPGVRGLKAKDGSLSDSPTLLVHASDTPQQKPHSRREESPLDFFFRADREEKARARSASSSQSAANVTSPFSPPGEPPRVGQTSQAIGSLNHTGLRSKASPSAIFAMELDGEGTSESPIGPAFSTPYAERISAARTCQQPSQDEQTTVERSEVLKAYLFSGHQSPSPLTVPVRSAASLLSSLAQSPTASQNSIASSQHPRNIACSKQSRQNNSALSYDSKPQGNGPRTSGRTSGLRQEVTPTTTPTKSPGFNPGYSTSPPPTRTHGSANPSDTHYFIGNIKSHNSTHGAFPGDRGADVRSMEDSLRKILKLDPSGSSEITGQIGSMPAASVSVPNYVGGRPPPMNGMHNGVMGS